MSAPPESIGRYQIRRELGRGMMGVVYLAHDPDLSRDIALKVIQLPAGASEDERASFEQRFFAEAQSAARLSHPGIVIVHDVGRDANTGSLFMALQLLKGQTLDALLKEQKKLDWAEALRLTKRVARALQHAHFEGVIHRDIKPSNIMIMPNGDPKIMDFGIAKIEASRLTAAGQFIGTPMYMSPEQAMARPVDGRSDIFSLGSVLYEMLTGVPAFAGESVTKILFQLMSAEPSPASALVPSLSISIDRILTRCLAKDLDHRYMDAGALASDIEELMAEIAPEEAADGRGGTVAAGAAVAPNLRTDPTPSDLDWSSLATRALTAIRRPTRRRAALPLAVGAGLLALLGLGWLVSLNQAQRPVARLIIPATDEAIAGQDSPEEPLPSPTEVAAIEGEQPAQLLIDFEHSLKSGVFRVYVDDLLVVDQSFGGRVTKRIIGLEMRKGRLIQTLAVEPGKRDIKVQVVWDDNVKTERSQTFFTPGGKLKLKAKVSGLRKGLSLEWN